MKIEWWYAKVLLNYDVVNLDTGKPMSHLVSVDGETGEWEAIALDADGRFYVDPDDRTRVATVRGVNRLKITPRDGSAVAESATWRDRPALL